MLLHTAPEGYASTAEAIAAADLTEATKQLRVPALIIVGDQDAATPVSSAEALQEALPGSKLALLSGVAHIPTVEKPTEVTDAIEIFLSSF